MHLKVSSVTHFTWYISFCTVTASSSGSDQLAAGALRLRHPQHPGPTLSDACDTSDVYNVLLAQHNGQTFTVSKSFLDRRQAEAFCMRGAVMA